MVSKSATGRALPSAPRRKAELTKVKNEETRRRAFGTALAEAMSTRRVTQLELGEQLGLTQSAVSAWRTAEAAPDPDLVFSIERALKLPPGNLSRHLGYYPPAAVNKAATVEEAAMNDTLLDEAGRRAVIAVWKELTTRAAARRGRRPKAR